jgi:hypothetical protein
MSETYTVLWAIDLEADDALDAARQALRTQRNPHSTALVFHVLLPADVPDLNEVAQEVVELADLADVTDHPVAAEPRPEPPWHLADLVAAADAVVAAWERGALAEAVNTLRLVADDARDFPQSAPRRQRRDRGDLADDGYRASFDAVTTSQVMDRPTLPRGVRRRGGFVMPPSNTPARGEDWPDGTPNHSVEVAQAIRLVLNEHALARAKCSPDPLDLDQVVRPRWDRAAHLDDDDNQLVVVFRGHQYLVTVDPYAPDPRDEEPPPGLFIHLTPRE